MTKSLKLLVIGIILLPFLLWHETTRSLLFGWIPFLLHTLPRMKVDWPSVGVGCVALVLFTGGVHVAGCLWRRRTPDGPSWRFRWSLAAVAGIFLLFAAGISIVGIVHQAGWMINSREPYFVQAMQVRGARDSRQSLHDLGIALQNYADIYRSLPGDEMPQRDGGMLHSWETKILWLVPSTISTRGIDFKLPYDHPQNEKYFKCIIPVFLNDSLPSAPVQDERGFGLSHFAANSRVINAGHGMRLQDITDGLPHTILVGEINADFKPWGHPINWRDPARGINRSRQGFGGQPNAGGAYFSMADGSVRFVSEKIDPEVLRALSTPNGGEMIDLSTATSDHGFFR